MTVDIVFLSLVKSNSAILINYDSRYFEYAVGDFE